MMVLGIDPGLASMGIALLVPTGASECPDFELEHKRTLKTESQHSTGDRLGYLLSELEMPIGHMGVDIVAVEKIFVTKMVHSTILDVAKVVGIIELLADTHGVEIRYVNPSAMKKLMTGSGRASKAQVLEGVEKRVGKGHVLTNHEADAAGMALVAGRGSGV